MKSKRSQGFTLVELLLVLAILGVIMAMVVPNLVNKQTYANIDATRGSISGAEKAIDLYSIDHLGRYPNSTQGFDVLLREPPRDKRWKGPYLTTRPKDAWGTPLKYEQPGSRNGSRFDIVSAGPDGVHGTNDDIGNWDLEDE